MPLGSLVNDCHCHFFSRPFFERLAQERGSGTANPVSEMTALLGWEAPGSAMELADRWVAELDRHGVGRAALIASVPGDEQSVAEAVARHPGRFVGFFMLDPTGLDAPDRVRRSLTSLSLRGVCLFPAMHQYRFDDAAAVAVIDAAASAPGSVVFAHCGVLSVGVRQKLGLPSRFDIRRGDPLDLLPIARQYPGLPFIVPHFGAGLFREALMLADACSNVYLDTSSSNGWTKFHPGLTLPGVFRQALAVVGADRLLFGTDSSFFPRGWQAPIHDQQRLAMADAGVEPAAMERIFGQNFDRLFPL